MNGPDPPGISPPSSSSLSQARVLVIDDEGGILDLVTRALALKGVAVSRAHSADLALETWQPGDVECIVSDIRMPGRTGLDLLKEVRCRDQDVGFVLMTAAGEVALARRAMRAGCDDFLMKPLALEDLYLSVQLALEKRSLRAKLHQDRDRFERLAAERTMRLQETLERLDDAFEAEKSAHRQTILVLAQAAESSERDMGRHIHRVAAFAAILGRRLGYDDAAADFLGLSATLHDVGKLAVPAELLTRKGPLSPAEFAKVQEHAVAGGRILDGVHFLQEAREIAVGHHERWDGGGYPYGLAGKSIPLAARIASLADVWDALSSRRCYKEAWPKERCMDYVERERGGHFDPEVVDVFVAAESEFDEVRRTLGDDARPAADLALLRPVPRLRASTPRLHFEEHGPAAPLN
jgi:putative two-component system response regulator